MDAGQQNFRPNDQKLGAEQVHILPGQDDCHRFNDPGGRLFHLVCSGYCSAEGFWRVVCLTWSVNRQHHQNLPERVGRRHAGDLLFVGSGVARDRFGGCQNREQDSLRQVARMAASHRT